MGKKHNRLKALDTIFWNQLEEAKVIVKETKRRVLLRVVMPQDKARNCQIFYGAFEKKSLDKNGNRLCVLQKVKYIETLLIKKEDK